MTISRFFLALSLTLVLALCASAQSSASVVKIRPAVSVDRVKQGATFQAAAVLDIDSGYHINSSLPTDSYLIATTLKITPEKGVSVATVAYPPGEMKKFAFSDKPLSVYEGRVILKFMARATTALSEGSHVFHGKLTIQACNDQACLQPKTVDVEIPYEVVPSNGQANAANGDIFGQQPSGKRH
jgi:thiol:disulfide interchange protein DsbD